MIISEKQIMQLIEIAYKHSSLIDQMIAKNLIYGGAQTAVNNINRLLFTINDQQADELKVME